MKLIVIVLLVLCLGFSAFSKKLTVTSCKLIQGNIRDEFLTEN